MYKALKRHKGTGSNPTVKQRINYEKELNPTQLEAIRSTEGPHLVIAGAGSGKTRVLVYRVAYLVEQGVRPDKILLLTFTRKAAEEMLTRASALLDDRCQRVSGGTFHSFANMVLRRYAPHLGLPHNFTILDQPDAENVIGLIRTGLGLGKLQKRFPRKKAILNIISKSINKSQSTDIILGEEYPHFYEYTEQIKRLKTSYIKYKKDKSLLDYDDLLICLKNLLKTEQELRHTLAKTYEYIMVDEYQDTNKLQADILRLLLCEHNNIMVVGDDAQSIYSFRGANFKNIIDFPRIFKKTKVITLEENYRSVQPILDLSNKVISYATESFEKRLFTKKPGDRLPIYIDAKDENWQSRYIADRVEELVADGNELGDIAILFRAGWHSNDLEIELARRSIPFVKYGGQKFIEAAHIKDMISYLRITHNRLDEVSWHRALLLMRGIGQKTAERLLRSITAERKHLPAENAIFKKSPDIRRLLELLKGVNPVKQAPVEIIEVFHEYYEPLLKERYDDFHKRAHDLDSLKRIASRYESLERFLTDMALEPPEKSVIDAYRRRKDKSRLILSTIHSAKGLEWHTVFLIYVAEGHLPSYQTFGNESAIEEERRLFYVAMTRAKEGLYLLKPLIDRSGRNYQNGDSSMFTQPSRFLYEGNILHNYVKVETGDNLDDFSNMESQVIPY